MKILVKFPSRERPDKFMRALTSCVERATDPQSLLFLFTFDRDDESMWGIADRISELNIGGEIRRGTRHSKIEAVNRDLNDFKEPWDILLLLSDDMICEQQGWDDIIRADMAKHYPDTDGLLWTFDGKQADICTLTIMGHKYYDRFGYIYATEYKSVFADDEQTAVARGLGRLAYSDTILFRHVHPANVTGVEKDDLHNRNETQAIWDADKAVFARRKAMNFGLKEAQAIDHQR